MRRIILCLRMSILLTIFDLSSRIFGTSDTKVYKTPPLQKKSEIFSIGYKQFFIFPGVFRSVRPMRPILFDRHRAVVCFSLSMRFRALCRSEFPVSRRLCFFVLRKLRSESFFRPEACGAIFRNSVFFDPSLLKRKCKFQYVVCQCLIIRLRIFGQSKRRNRFPCRPKMTSNLSPMTIRIVF